jgi:oligopeptide/dipeptide ABC transporter ATP-binding protein
MTALLAVEGLTVDYGRSVRAIDGADLVVDEGETVGIVGESGSGKSTLGAAIGRLLPRDCRLGGSVRVAGESVLALPKRKLRQLRREQLGYVFQDPIGSLDPTMRIGRQLSLAGLDPVPALENVRLPGRVASSYPHELSGGMAQRVAIALAMAGGPRLLIADEPTAALDSQVREEVLDVIFSLAASEGTSILWLSHDLTAVARRCDRVAVMYGGRVVEDGPAQRVLGNPAHPYTAALARSAPANAVRGERLEPVPGRPPVLTEAAHGCAFAPRCSYVVEKCLDQRPVPSGDQQVLCHRTKELV